MARTIMSVKSFALNVSDHELVILHVGLPSPTLPIVHQTSGSEGHGGEFGVRAATGSLHRRVKGQRASQLSRAFENEALEEERAQRKGGARHETNGTQKVRKRQNRRTRQDQR